MARSSGRSTGYMDNQTFQTLLTKCVHYTRKIYSFKHSSGTTVILLLARKQVSKSTGVIILRIKSSWELKMKIGANKVYFSTKVTDSKKQFILKTTNKTCADCKSTGVLKSVENIRIILDLERIYLCQQVFQYH